MVSTWKLKVLCVVSGVCVFISLSWCWNSLSWEHVFSTNVYWFDLKYNGNIELERVQLKDDDLDEILDLYQEVWENVDYRDSLLIAEKYAQWLWPNAFVQDNIDTLKTQWLTVSNVEKTQIKLVKDKNKINLVLVEYEITKWLIEDIPLLYVSQLFIPDEENIILMSFITEDKSSHLSASNMFKNIK